MSFIKIMSPSWRSGFFVVHFRRGWRVARYSSLYLFQKEYAKLWTWHHCTLHRWSISKFPGGAGLILAFWVKRVAGKSISGILVSSEIGTSGLEFMMAINVVRTSWVSLVAPSFTSSASRTHLATLINLSQAPPMCNGVHLRSMCIPALSGISWSQGHLC